MSVWFKVCGPGHRERIVRRAEALEAVIQGGKPMGNDIEGYECIVFPGSGPSLHKTSIEVVREKADQSCKVYGAGQRMPVFKFAGSNC